MKKLLCAVLFSSTMIGIFTADGSGGSSSEESPFLRARLPSEPELLLLATAGDEVLPPFVSELCNAIRAGESKVVEDFLVSEDYFKLDAAMRSLVGDKLSLAVRECQNRLVGRQLRRLLKCYKVGGASPATPFTLETPWLEGT